MNRWHN